VSARMFTWDYRAQPEMDDIAAAVAELSGGRVFMREVNTRSDEYAWVVSDTELTDEQAERLYFAEDEEG
jgi:hypothetical protein